ncbi:carboxylesterase/lipase family protein [Rhodococcus sp. IEGM 1379]|uniref:carboxylesterase/lipase family protein n=1 Tax=Rhodococcus sp. IEGM 1379 TaxID=3047086 RepID=UPI0024B64E3B|nr:carboxylesterase/lipase family protein [Rhodococcus sp. IEGM 1379]MDI9915234.1 carboxylesterase/lipase family protein [Rhodococcus sp. IEGM 1379]
MDHLEVVVDSGKIRGRLLEQRAGKVGKLRTARFRTWRAIPYAAPPVGPLRFRAPQPVEPWQGIRSAAEFGSPAPQSKGNLDENCLLLNVLASQHTSDEPRPVMVFIHGGAYNGGNPSAPMYHGTSLVERGNIIYVSIQYRLGALGYLDFSELSTDKRSFESNLGLRDQVSALEWVQRNIAAFGGDPHNVTVFGESSGANAVTTLMATPAATGLFAQAIAQSPPAASAYGKDRAHRWAQEFLEIAHASATDPASWLCSASVGELVDAGEELARRGADEEPGTRAFAPVVGDDFLPEHPLDVFAAGNAHPIPFLVGSNLHEGRIFPRFLNILPTDPARIDKMFSHTSPDVKERALAAYPTYPHRNAAADLGGDITFWEPAILCAQGHCTVAPTYSYRYDFAPRLLRLLGIGATHATELFAVFGRSDALIKCLTIFGGRRSLHAVTETMQNHWLHFARQGTPGSDWPQYSTANRETMIFDSTSYVDNDPLADRRRAWIGYQHRR